MTNSTTATCEVDVPTMRQTVVRLLGSESEPPAGEELETLTALLRGHMELLVPEIEQAAVRLPHDDVPRYCALACVGEARLKLRARPGPGEYGALAHARRLARVLGALCDHHETLTGVRMCVVCDRPITADAKSLPYPEAAPSGAARASRVHAGCADTVRLRR